MLTDGSADTAKPAADASASSPSGASSGVAGTGLPRATQRAATARTISLIEPCAELVRDERQDATVDVVLGSKFDDLHPNRAAKTLVEQLNDFAKQNPPAQGGLQADAPQPKLDSALLTAARNVKC